jgi:predicted nucleic acid-binding Zn ribbon protein
MDDSTVNGNYCSNCGSPLEQDTNYCSQCGTQCRVVSPPDTSKDSGDDSSSESDDEAEMHAFRQRVQQYVMSGWEIEHDRGDSVVLVDRGYGSIWIHLLIFFCTFFTLIANFIYAWHSYENKSTRKMIRVNGINAPTGNINYTNGTVPAGDMDIDSYHEKSDDGSSVVSYVIGSILLLIGVGTIVSAPLSIVAVIFGLLMLSGAAWAFPPTRQRLKNRHPVTEFGPVRSTDAETVSDPGRPCVICGSAIESGIKRSYREEYVIAGIPLFTTETGENHYCEECNTGDMNYKDVAPMGSDGPAETGSPTDGDRPTGDKGTLETEEELTD